MMSRPLALDLFCGQGGAGMGYHRAGFDVIGVDIDPQPRYPFEFVQADALSFLVKYGHKFDVIHASPPCHDHSPLSALRGKDGTGWLLDATRTALVKLDKPWVIENVSGAVMYDPLVLCGSMFDLSTVCKDGVRRQLRRHRKFEYYGMNLTAPCNCRHFGQPIGVYGTGGGGQMTRGYKGDKNESLAVMGTPWMDRKGVSQAIPPAYTEHIGLQLIEQLAERAA